MHVPVFPLFGHNQQIEPGAVICVEPNSDTRYSFSVTHADTATGIKLGAAGSSNSSRRYSPMKKLLAAAGLTTPPTRTSS
jgi:hypothetical protein